MSGGLLHNSVNSTNLQVAVDGTDNPYTDNLLLEIFTRVPPLAGDHGGAVLVRGEGAGVRGGDQEVRVGRGARVLRDQGRGARLLLAQARQRQRRQGARRRGRLCQALLILLCLFFRHQVSDLATQIRTGTVNDLNFVGQIARLERKINCLVCQEYSWF